MFKFKKAMEGIKKEEGFECECCGPMEGKASSGCASGCGPVKSACGAPMDGFSGNTAIEEAQESTESGCKCSCSGK